FSFLRIKGWATIEKNLFLGLGGAYGLQLTSNTGSKTTSILNNIFYQTKPGIGLQDGSYANTFNIDKNHFIENSSDDIPTATTPTTAGPATVLNVDQATTGSYVATFTNNLIFGNNATQTDSSLLHIWDPGNISTPSVSITANNFIANNATYFIYNLLPSTDTDVSATGNYWDTIVTTEIDDLIHDSKDDASLNTVSYLSSYLGSPATSAPLSVIQGISVSGGSGGSATVAWTPGPESDISGYRVYWDTTTQNIPYTNSQDCPLGSSCVISGITTGTTYFTVTSLKVGHDGSNDMVEGYESYYGDAVSHSITP
ncbi:MAG: fibronectin type III domain-containing protein, partial [Zetaproteobacteria bacterium]|nr:fibronectin type III domain-containing protein [Zetaproteobacteria bacterium]